MTRSGENWRMIQPKMILTGDIFRPHGEQAHWESATWKNVRWLDGVVGTAARLANWDVSTVSCDLALRRAHGHVDVQNIYRSMGLPANHAGWLELLSLPALPPKVEEYLLQLYNADVIVGYELPKYLRDLFDKSGKTVIDIILYPVRFMDDIIFSSRTNKKEIYDLLVQHEFPREEIFLQAGRIKSKAAWMPQLQEMPYGTTLLLGQVKDDIASADTVNKRFRTFSDYAEELRDICVNSSCVLFKPHPYDNQNSTTMNFIRKIKSIRLVDKNFYYLLAQPTLDVVCALNSSGLVEAEFFGKKINRLAPPYFTFGSSFPAEAQYSDAVAQKDHWTRPNFWRLLKQDQPVEENLSSRPNRLRRTLNADWGFLEIDRIVAC